MPTNAPIRSTTTTYAYAHGRGHLALTARAEADTELLIYGYIGDSFWDESTTARDVVAALSGVTGGRVIARIQSGGGSVADGVAIHNALRGLSARGVQIITRNEGMAASIAGLILMAGDTVESYANATFMVHAPWAVVAGDSAELREAADYLDTLAAGIATSYARKTGRGADHALALMTNGRDNFFTAAEAQAEGFVDVIVDDSPAAAAPEDDAPAEAAARRTPPRRQPLPGVLQAAAALELFPDLQRPPRAPLPPSKPQTLTPTAAARGSHPEHTMPAPNPAPAQSPAETRDTTHQPAGADALAANRARISEIRALFAAYPQARTLAPSLEGDLIADDTVTAAAAGRRILETLAAATPPPTPTGNLPRVEAGADSRDHLRAGLENALLHRANPAANKLDDNGRAYRGMNLVRMAEAAVVANNLRVEHIPGKLAAQALHSTSDFPLVLENVLTKTLRAAYESSPRSFLPFCRAATLPDFKTVSRAQLGGAPSLSRVVEGGEYEQGTIGEGAEKYSVQKYGRIVHISWETVVNDDLDAFTRVPAMFGRSAADLESDIVYGVLTANANMADGNALFSAAHGNLAASGTAITEAGLTAARQAMLLQTGIEGRYITVRPEYLIVPPGKLTEAQKIISAVIPDATGNVNVFQGALQVIVEPRLHPASANAWYLSASPNAIDTIEYAYLEGYEGVFTETMNGFDVDGLKIKCRHVFGAKAIDWRGLYRNPGA